ncbi:CidA/LrgA family protein [Gorillibacterium sp. sgz500922]|uniref:CidA/LrgA family protein n=1 Tax=Gorillibacterium sp. sgz500922 TaxID=3446694 RepID=UPI003F6646A8
MRRITAIILQVLLCSGIALLGDYLVELAHLKISGSILGMVLLFVLLKSGILKLHWFEGGADWLHSRLVLFFVPSAVGISQYGALMKSDGVFLLLTIVISTLAVMVVTGWSGHLLNRFARKPIPAPIPVAAEEEKLHG